MKRRSSATVGVVIRGEGRHAVGWADVATAYAATFAPLCAGAVDPLLSAAGVGGIGTVVTSQSDDVREAMRSAYGRLVLPLVHDGELVLPTEALLAVGTR